MSEKKKEKPKFVKNPYPKRKSSFLEGFECDDEVYLVEELEEEGEEYFELEEKEE